MPLRSTASLVSTREGIGDEGDHGHALAAADAEQRIDLVDLTDQACPAW